MAASQPGDPRQNPSEKVSPHGDASAYREMDPDFLEGVLRETLSLTGSDKPMAVETNAALSALLARHEGAPFSLEPIAVELVAVVLKTQFLPDSASSMLCDAVAAQVAQTLCEDPPSRARLEAFWNRLAGRS